MNKAEKITIKVLKVVERIARNEVEKTVLGRTAECSAIYHQPKRPKKRENQVRIMKYFVECCGCDYRNGKTKGDLTLKNDGNKFAAELFLNS